jgi:hypothetical protein
MIARQMKECVLECDTANDRICNLRMERRYRNIAMILTHAPTEEFYECLEQTYHNIHKYGLAIIMGDY